MIEAHLEALQVMKPVTKITDIKGLRKLYDICNNHSCNLKNLGIDFTVYGHLIKTFLLKALPRELRDVYEVERTQGAPYVLNEIFTISEMTSRKQGMSSMLQRPHLG